MAKYLKCLENKWHWGLKKYETQLYNQYNIGPCEAQEFCTWLMLKGNIWAWSQVCTPASDQPTPLFI